MRKASSLLCFMAAAAACSLATSAHAAAPGDWSVAVERLFGISRSTADFEPGGTITTTSVSLLAKVSREVAYSAPRLAFDYLPARGVALTLLPHADIGLGGSFGGVDRTVTEIGLQFGMALFL